MPEFWYLLYIRSHTPIKLLKQSSPARLSTWASCALDLQHHQPKLSTASVVSFILRFYLVCKSDFPITQKSYATLKKRTFFGWPILHISNRVLLLNSVWYWIFLAPLTPKMRKWPINIKGKKKSNFVFLIWKQLGRGHFLPPCKN